MLVHFRFFAGWHFTLKNCIEVLLPAVKPYQWRVMFHTGQAVDEKKKRKKEKKKKKDYFYQIKNSIRSFPMMALPLLRQTY
jgi:hypothetical protein